MQGALENMAKACGRLPGGLGISVVVVGAMLAARFVPGFAVDVPDHEDGRMLDDFDRAVPHGEVRFAVADTGLGLPPGRKTKTGFSVDHKTLTEMKDLHPIVGLILEHREARRACAVTLGDGVTVGPYAIIGPQVTVGDRCVIGANSVVTRDLPPFSIAAGAPAKVLRGAAYTSSGSDLRITARSKMMQECSTSSSVSRLPCRC